MRAFISYASIEHGPARSAKRALEARGWQCFLAADDIPQESGEGWVTAVLDALDRTNALVVMGTSRSVARGCVRAEYMRVAEAIANDQRRVIATIHESGDLPATLRRHAAFPAARAYQDRAHEQLFDKLDAHLRRELERPSAATLAHDGVARRVCHRRLLVSAGIDGCVERLEQIVYEGAATSASQFYASFAGPVEPTSDRWRAGNMRDLREVSAALDQAEHRLDDHLAVTTDPLMERFWRTQIGRTHQRIAGARSDTSSIW